MATKVVELVSNGTLSVEKKYGMTYEEFAKDHLFANYPVVIGDACKDWAAKEKFTPDFFKSTYGDRTVEVDGKRYTVAEFIDIMESATVDNPAPYPCKLQIDREYPELIPDISPRFEFANPDWSHHPLVKPFIGSADTHEIFLGSPGGQFPYVHYDYLGFHAFITQLYGIKEFTVIPPDQTPYVYPKKDNAWVSDVPNIKNIDLEKFPLCANVTPITFSVGPGETLFIPNGWWHTANSTTVTISVALDSLNASNWNRFKNEVFVKASKRNSTVAKMVTAYLSVLGKGLRASNFNGINS
ncbi:MAG: cupin-like domain-containing protein [Aquaticitalea sp.]